MIRNKVIRIQGWFDWLNFYQDITSEAPVGSTVVEVGVWLGLSICYLAQLSNQHDKNLKIFGIDNFLGEQGHPYIENFVKENGGNIKHLTQANIKKYNFENSITLIESDSSKAAKKFKDKSLFLVYIDAGHTYKEVKKDINAWWPKIQKGGYLAGHDFGLPNYPGVDKAVLERFPDVQHKLPQTWFKIKE